MMAIQAGTTAYNQATRGVVQDGLTLHLDAGVKESYSGGTTWRDLSGNGYNGSAYNGASYTKVKGGSFSFDGSNDYIGISSPSNRFAWTPSGNGLNTMSIDIWLKTTDIGGAFLSKPWNGSGSYNYRINYDSFRLQSTVAYFSSSLATGNWINIVCIATPTQMAAYTNGSLHISFRNHNISSNFSGTNNQLDLTLMTLYPYGSYGWSNTGFSVNGNLSICRIYNKALSVDEVTRNYNATRHRFGI